MRRVTGPLCMLGGRFLAQDPRALARCSQYVPSREGKGGGHWSQPTRPSSSAKWPGYVSFLMAALMPSTCFAALSSAAKTPAIMPFLSIRKVTRPTLPRMFPRRLVAP